MLAKRLSDGFFLSHNLLIFDGVVVIFGVVQVVLNRFIFYFFQLNTNFKKPPFDVRIFSATGANVVFVEAIDGYDVLFVNTPIATPNPRFGLNFIFQKRQIKRTIYSFTTIYK